MRRREFIGLVGAATAWPLTAWAQRQPAMPLVGYLDSFEPEIGASRRVAFLKGLNEAGYAEGRNVTIEYHDQRGHGPELAAELVRRRASVIVSASLNGAIRAKEATTSIPIVFAAGGNPVASGLVASLNRPGGNVTGVSSLGGELGEKRLGLLHELVPRAKRVAVLVDPITEYAKPTIEEARRAAAALGLDVNGFTARTRQDIDSAFSNLVQWRADALVLAQAALFESRRIQLATLVAHHRLPTIYAGRSHAEVGGLISYGAGWADLFRQVGIYTGRILKGEKPSDLPVMQPTRFELLINLQTARTLGIEVPATLLALADEVIE